MQAVDRLFKQLQGERNEHFTTNLRNSCSCSDGTSAQNNKSTVSGRIWLSLNPWSRNQSAMPMTKACTLEPQYTYLCCSLLSSFSFVRYGIIAFNFMRSTLTSRSGLPCDIWHANSTLLDSPHFIIYALAQKNYGCLILFKITIVSLIF